MLHVKIEDNSICKYSCEICKETVEIWSEAGREGGGKRERKCMEQSLTVWEEEYT